MRSFSKGKCRDLGDGCSASLVRLGLQGTAGQARGRNRSLLLWWLRRSQRCHFLSECHSRAGDPVELSDFATAAGVEKVPGRTELSWVLRINSLLRLSTLIDGGVPLLTPALIYENMCL